MSPELQAALVRTGLLVLGAALPALLADYTISGNLTHALLVGLVAGCGVLVTAVPANKLGSVTLRRAITRQRTT